MRFCPILPKPNSPNPILPKPISSIGENNRTLTLTLFLTLNVTLSLSYRVLGLGDMGLGKMGLGKMGGHHI